MNNIETYEVSIVIPTYNSAKWIKNTVDKLYSTLNKFFLLEVILVNDCSKDSTLYELEKLKTIYGSTLVIINNLNNIGQHRSTEKGIIAAKGNYIVTYDDDAQYTPDGILLLHKFAIESGSDLVYGQGFFKYSSISLKVLMYMAYLKYLMWTKQERKTSFRIITKNLAKKIEPLNSPVIFNIDGLLLAKAEKIGYVKVESVLHSNSRYTLTKLVLYSISFFIGQIQFFFRRFQ